MPTSLFDVPSPFIADACSIWICPSEERTIRDLKELPKEEREKVWADLSGDDYLYCAIQPDTCIASPEEEQLMQLNEELLKVEGSLPSIPAVKNYISQHSFRLMFLRSNQGNSAAAAKQIVKHLHLKEYLFGSQVLAKDIELEDLNEQDMAALSGGTLQWIFQRDRCQRLVYLVRTRDLFETKLPPDSILRAHFYHCMEAARDEQNQRLGFVMVNYFLDDPKTGGANYELIRRASKFENAIPLRCVAQYIAFQNSRWKPVADVICHIASPKIRVRTRTIFGSYTEVMHALLNLGIHPSSIPITEDGEMDFSRSKEWIEKRRIVAKSKLPMIN